MIETVSTGLTPVSGRVSIRSISADDVYGALALGWADFRAAPRFGLFFGGIYALVGIVIFLQLWVWERPLWIVPLALAFPLIGPFVAIGLYEVSRRRELGLPLDWAGILGVVWNQRSRQMPSMAFVVLTGFMVWIFAAQLIVALFLGSMSGAVYSDPDAILNSNGGMGMLAVGTLVGGGIAGFLFAITAVSLPMLLERDLDVVTAMVASFQVVVRNPHAMLNWAWIVGASLLVAMVPMFLGLFIALPVLGHATWHLYRKAIDPAV